MKNMITFWKDTGNETLRGKTVELFKVSWDDNRGWVRNENGPYWGMYKLGTEEVRRLTHPPEEMGNIVAVFQEEDHPEVVNLEAEDLKVTPEAGDLGEEEQQQKKPLVLLLKIFQHLARLLTEH